MASSWRQRLVLGIPFRCIASFQNRELQERDVGSVRWSVVMFYLLSCTGFLGIVALLILFIMVEVSRVFSDYWLAEWSSTTAQRAFALLIACIAADPNPSLKHYLPVYFLLGIAYCVIMLGRNILVAVGGVRGSRQMHDGVLHSVLRAPTQFFDTTPIGRVLSRSSALFRSSVDANCALGSRRIWIR